MVQIFENQNTQDVLPFKGKITTVMYYEPETGFAIFKIRQEGETKSSTAKGYVPNPVAGAKIYYNGTWKEDQKFGGYYIAISNSYKFHTSSVDIYHKTVIEICFIAYSQIAYTSFFIAG